MKHTRLVLLFLLVFLTVSCLPSSQESSQETYTLTPNSDPATLSFWHTFNDEEVGTLKAVLKEFEAEYPHLKVQLQSVPFSDALNKYKTVAQAGNAPDLFRADIGWTTELASLGYLLALDGLLKPELKDDFLPQAMAYTQFKNHTWGLPQVTDCLALFYNKTLFPNGPAENLDAFVEQAKALTQPPERYGFFYRGDPYWYLPFVWGFGGELISDKDLSIKIAEQPAVDALQFLIDLRHKHKVVPESVDFANDYENQQIGFKNGQYAAIINGPWSTADILEGPEFKENPGNLGITRVPAGPGGHGSPVGGHNYVMSADSKHIWATWQLMQFLNRPEHQAKFALNNNLLPTRKSAYEIPEVKSNRIIQSFKFVLDAANNRPVIPQGGAIFIDLKPAYQAALLQEKPPQEALKEVEQAWQKLLQSD